MRLKMMSAAFKSPAFAAVTTTRSTSPASSSAMRSSSTLARLRLPWRRPGFPGEKGRPRVDGAFWRWVSSVVSVIVESGEPILNRPL